MRFSRIIAAALLLVGALFACQKDQLQTASSLPYEDSHEHHQAIDGMEVFADLKELRGTYPLAADLVEGELTKMSAAKDLREYTVTNIVATQDGNGGHLFTGFLDAFRGNIYKLIFQTDASERVINLGVLEIELSPEYLREYFADNSTFGKVTGSVKGLTPEGFLEKTETNNETIADCWEVVFNGGRGVRGEVVNGGSGNGSGNGGLSPGDGFGGGGVWTGDDLPAGCTFQTIVTCGCDPVHIGGRRGHPTCICRKPDIVVTILTCESASHESDMQSASTRDEKNEYWDCVNLLTSAGLLTESDLHKQRLMDCAGLGDPYDVGGNPSAEHPDASFCTAWNNYVTRCLPGVPLRGVVDTWGELMYQNNEAFEYILENDNSCGGAAIANLILENPELELEEEEVCVLLINPELVAPINTFMDNNPGDSGAEVVHSLLATSSERCSTNLTPEMVEEITAFWDSQDIPFLNSNDCFEEFLEDAFEVDIVSVTIIDGVIMGVDSENVLHIYLGDCDSGGCLDMSTASEEDIFDHILHVINLAQLYFCQTSEDYKPIDWRDYFTNIRSMYGVVNWGRCEIGFDYNFQMNSRYLMDIDPLAHHYSSGYYTWKWGYANTNIPMIQFSSRDNQSSCIDNIENLIAPDCD